MLNCLAPHNPASSGGGRRRRRGRGGLRWEGLEGYAADRAESASHWLNGGQVERARVARVCSQSVPVHLGDVARGAHHEARLESEDVEEVGPVAEEQRVRVRGVEEGAQEECQCECGQ